MWIFVVIAIIIVLFIIWLAKSGRIVVNKPTESNDDSSKNSVTETNYKKSQYAPIEYKSLKISTPQNKSAPPTYEVFHRNKDGFFDNMNYRIYQCKGLFAKTNRKRTLKIEAFNEDEAMEQLKQKGFIEPFEIERIQFPEVTDNQRASLGNISFGDICQFDASALLSKQYDKDTTPNPELLAYATECGLKFSYYIGKKALYDLIFNTVDLKEKIAFFVFCIYRYTTDDRQGNLHNSLYQDYFYKFAEENIENVDFLKSMNKYNGHDLRFFGKLTINNIQTTGGSTNTNAYKTVIEYLKQKFTLSTISNKTI